MSKPESETRGIIHQTRRQALGAMGALGVALFAGCGGGGGGSSDSASTTTTTSSSTSSGGTTSSDLSCVVTPEVTEGPYFVDEKLERYDLTGDTIEASVLNGLPLYLEITVYDVSSGSCTPAGDVQIDIWHASATGLYSDEAVQGTSGETFLRGYQVTGSDGTVSFKTIYPGWYSGRTVHIHIKARRYDGSGNQTQAATTQMFFDDSVTDEVMASLPYSSRGGRDTRNATDNIYKDGLLLELGETADGSGYTGVFTLGLEVG